MLALWLPQRYNEARPRTKVQHKCFKYNKISILYVVKIGKINKVSFVIKIFPFAYTFVQVLWLICYIFDDGVGEGLSKFLYLSPVAVALLLLLSHILHLCIWHKIQCCLLIFPNFIIFANDDSLISLVMCCCVLIASLINAIIIITAKDR